MDPVPPLYGPAVVRTAGAFLDMTAELFNQSKSP